MDYKILHILCQNRNKYMPMKGRFTQSRFSFNVKYTVLNIYGVIDKKS
jgi:hypothetical protein